MTYYFKKWIEKIYLSIPGNLAIYDQLTGLYNFNWFEKFGKQKYQNKDIYITMIDLDNFKAINDKKGHEYANNLLKDIAIQLDRVKEIDQDADIMRYGGDEFIIFSNIDLEDRLRYENHKTERLISWGIYHKNPDEGIHIAIDIADSIMYSFKNKYRNNCIGG